MAARPEWSVMLGGRFEPYDAQVASVIEEAFQRRDAEVQATIDGRLYVIVLKPPNAMKQRSWSVAGSSAPTRTIIFCTPRGGARRGAGARSRRGSGRASLGPRLCAQREWCNGAWHAEATGRAVGTRGNRHLPLR